MRKIVLVAAMVLVSASAHAGDRSLSVSPVTEQSSAPQTTTPAAPATHTTEVAPATQDPKYFDRPPVVSLAAPVVATAPAAPTTATPASTTKPAKIAKPARTAKASTPRLKPYWTERRIVAELHRHGIYW
ncbi:hypothetical protein [Bradyrhizobium sp. BR13661]|jgi:hypothetical protein|uniref:hypothetical protein n=1 Tax=Bradyrhizobium sp. BR13661 TaxID=2940622 RepID=UPI002473A786|nr:hypothetical protein [Bradyrhizobium sp. BR13661]MDH6261412.1 heme-binding NEAT domain protein [Bradyrhizobium sp. BR13661]